MKNILTIAVHPDDETLGCGGTLLRFKAKGAVIHWLIVTSIYGDDGEGFLTIDSCSKKSYWRHDRITPTCYPMHKVVERGNELNSVRNAYFFDTVHELFFPTVSLDQVPLEELVGSICRIINYVKPDTIIMPFKADVHSDHRMVFKAAYSCTKSFRNPFLRRVMMMETISETDFAPSTTNDVFCPNLYVNITEYLERKIEIMGLYNEEMGLPPFPRSEENIRALALMRGSVSGFKYAEAFMLLKECI